MHVLISSKFPTDEKIYGWWDGEVIKYLLSQTYDFTSILRAHMKVERMTPQSCLTSTRTWCNPARHTQITHTILIIKGNIKNNKLKSSGKDMVEIGETS